MNPFATVSFPGDIPFGGGNLDEFPSDLPPGSAPDTISNGDNDWILDGSKDFVQQQHMVSTSISPPLVTITDHSTPTQAVSSCNPVPISTMPSSNVQPSARDGFSWVSGAAPQPSYPLLHPGGLAAKLQSVDTLATRPSSSSPPSTKALSPPPPPAASSSTPAFQFVDAADRKSIMKIRNTMVSRKHRDNKVKRIAELEKLLAERDAEIEELKRGRK